jgi:hypothetical protein
MRAAETTAMYQHSMQLQCMQLHCMAILVSLHNAR